ncbi:unnamed protein product [Protopolystoma xenopodis]|uniref:Uncharacterized protein n=1 Tax=Protopolystoma xenopodis TaxID=117903 RepID=A0A3S5CT97_9PLAT|nr:unnamed protein product [Protopolystoma xenopodis]
MPIQKQAIGASERGFRTHECVFRHQAQTRICTHARLNRSQPPACLPHQLASDLPPLCATGIRSHWIAKPRSMLAG